MLSGDNQTVATAIGQQLGLDEVRAGLLPEQKVSAVQELVNNHGDVVAMVGDGVNDAPALAAATVGIAMGASGTAQRARQIIQFNIWFALAIKAVFLVAALGGVATLWMAVFADTGASLLVTLNGMRLLQSTRRAEVSHR